MFKHMLYMKGGSERTKQLNGRQVNCFGLTSWIRYRVEIGCTLIDPNLIDTLFLPLPLSQ